MNPKLEEKGILSGGEDHELAFCCAGTKSRLCADCASQNSALDVCVYRKILHLQRLCASSCRLKPSWLYALHMGLLFSFKHICLFESPMIMITLRPFTPAPGSVLVGPLGDPTKGGTEHGEVHIPAIIKIEMVHFKTQI